MGAGFLRATTTGDGPRTAALNVLQAELGGVEEEVTADGLHLFSACTYAHACRRLAEWTLPVPGHGQAHGTERISAAAWPRWVARQLGPATRQVSLLLFLPRAGGELGEESWLVAHDEAAAVLAEPLDDEASELRVSAVSPGALADRLAERVGAALPRR